MRSKVESSKGTAKRQNPFNSSGGNGGYAKKKAVSETKNRQNTPKKPYTYAGKDVRKS